MRIGDDKDPFVILGNVPELSAVFETKARAPFKIVFEVCRLSELIEETMAEEKGAVATDALGASEEEKKESSEGDNDDSKPEGQQASIGNDVAGAA